MPAKRINLLLGEIHESFLMAMNAVTAHKLRSALTLLGVLIGVFSIIVVMTAMRVLQSRIEAQISSLGSQTFMIRKWPAIFFTLPEGIEKIRRRKNITLQQGLRFQEKVTLAQSVGIQSYFWAGEIQTAHAKTAPDVQMLGETPGSFSARNWTLSDGRILADTDIKGVRDVCVLGYTLATNLFPSVSPIGERLKIDGINYTVVGVLEPQGSSLGGDQDNFAVIPITTGLNRYGGSWWRSLRSARASARPGQLRRLRGAAPRARSGTCRRATGKHGAAEQRGAAQTSRLVRLRRDRLHRPGRQALLALRFRSLLLGSRMTSP